MCAARLDPATARSTASTKKTVNAAKPSPGFSASPKRAKAANAVARSASANGAGNAHWSAAAARIPTSVPTA